MEIKCIPFMETRVSHPKVCWLASPRGTLRCSAVLYRARQYSAVPYVTPLSSGAPHDRTDDMQHAACAQHNLNLYKLKDVMSSPVATAPVLCT